MIQSPDRLAVHLDTAARIANAARVVRAEVPRPMGAAELAERIAVHLRHAA